MIAKSAFIAFSLVITFVAARNSAPSRSASPSPVHAPATRVAMVFTEDSEGYPGAITGEVKQFIEITESTPGYPGVIYGQPRAR